MNGGAGALPGLPTRRGREDLLAFPATFGKGMSAKLWAGLQGNVNSGALSIGAFPTKEKRQTKQSRGVAYMTHPRGWGLDQRGVSWVCSKPLVRKGQDDGNHRLAWRGNSQTSRHLFLLPQAPTSCYSPAPLPGGSTPLEGGQRVIPRSPARGAHKLLFNPMEQPYQQGMVWAWRGPRGKRKL